MRITLSISTLASAAVAALLSMPAALLAQSEEVTLPQPDRALPRAI